MSIVPPSRIVLSLTTYVSAVYARPTLKSKRSIDGNRAKVQVSQWSSSKAVGLFSPKEQPPSHAWQPQS